MILRKGMLSVLLVPNEAAMLHMRMKIISYFFFPLFRYY